MENFTRTYVSRRLSKALDWLDSRPSKYEGLYSAYEESLQWLEDMDENELPLCVIQVLKDFRGQPDPLPVESRVLHVGSRILTMSEADVRDLANRLQTVKQSLCWHPAKVA